ncbi:uncharacterized protein MKK02DRAFT_43417 [Dioszegia hungarica]|uniref:EF-hand domain-containing protein n=1 Tax=Dioszegia hungarica TaxID=4972 RepID=A0AA38HBT2_9TREE|nr:uncharacterized protein MKK02DRAFT_43417 [Dioszegia hungarica]KAI9637491.1 hypothetical protein MKK02DRAFT_43417 [Dioszegia hungarica]
MNLSKQSSLGQGLPSNLQSSSGHGGGHAPREASGGAYTMFDPQQVKQFKEAFAMIDQDGDGRVTEEDLRTMLSSLGQTPTPSLLSNLLTDPSGHRAQSVNFTQFLSMMGRHLLALDAEHDLLEAFACFDEGDKGWVKVDEVRKLLAEMGDRMDEREIDRLFAGPFTDRQGRFNYVEWAKVLRVNDGEEERDDKLKM